MTTTTTTTTTAREGRKGATMAAHTLTTEVTITESPATEAGALDGFKASCHGCGASASFSIRSMTEGWGRDHVRLMTGWGK